MKAWAEALLKRPSTHSFPEAEFEALYRLNVKLRKKYLSQFIADRRWRRSRADRAQAAPAFTAGLDAARRLDDLAELARCRLFCRAANCSGVSGDDRHVAASELRRAPSGAVIALAHLGVEPREISGGSFAGPKKPNQVDGLRNAGTISVIDGTFGILA